MPFVVERTAQAKGAVDADMTKKDRDAYHATVANLKVKDAALAATACAASTATTTRSAANTYAPTGGCSPPTSTMTAS